MTCLNILLDYLLIFGNFGFPRLGITGAGIATVTSSAFVTIAYLILFCRHSNNLRFQTRSSWRLQKRLLLRILRFGTPSGAHFFLDVMGFTVFVLLIGRIGTVELAASNIALNINLLSLLPMIGLGTAASIMVGRFQGARQSPLAVKTTYSALHMAVVHNTVMASLYWFAPEILISPFIQETSGGDLPLIESTASSLLRYFAIIIFLDSLIIMTGGALKGAGDTRYVMTVLAFTSIFFLVIPAYILIEVLHQPASVAWICAIVNLAVVALAFSLRFRSRKWQNIDVIER